LSVFQIAQVEDIVQFFRHLTLSSLEIFTDLSH
jgi:hypothetical protein